MNRHTTESYFQFPRLFRVWILSLLILFLPGSGRIQAQAETTLGGTVTTQEGAIYLPGVEVTLINTLTAQQAAATVSDDLGRFDFGRLAPGVYQVTAGLVGFQEAVLRVELKPGDALEVKLDLEVARPEETVEVVGETQTSVPETGTSQQHIQGDMIDIAPIAGEDFRDLLPVLPGVVRSADGLLSIKGGDPTQNNLLINGANVADPATNHLGAYLPADAIDSADVLPNPYAPQYGRFSAGMVQIQTVQGNNKWHFTGNNFAPRLKERNGTYPFGIEAWTPRIGFRGPLVKDRLYFAQNLNYRYVVSLVDTPRIPETEGDTRLESLLSFTQFDAPLNARHHLTGTFSFFPRKLDFVNLDSFNPQQVTPSFDQGAYNIALRETAVLSSSAVLESLLSYTSYDIRIYGQGNREMELFPEMNSGHYFNRQERETRTLQWKETVNLLRSDWGGEHLFQMGFDLIHARLDGGEENSPVNVRRLDGTLSERIEFSGPTSQRLRSTDFALFLGDRWRVNDRLVLEPGVRFDRDGVLENNHLAPRLGFVFQLLPEARGVLRGGAGLFYDRTPLYAGVFGSLSERRITRFAADGQTLQGRPLHFTHRLAQDLDTPYSLTWNLEYDHRLTNNLILKTNFLRRRGFHEFLIDPLQGGSSGALLLDTRGRSTYWEWEWTARYGLGEKHELLFSYVRSRSKRDLNSFDTFFGNFRRPIIRANEFSLGDTDAPNRFLFRGTFPLLEKWTVAPLLEIRDGFPYSLIDEEREFVGTRNRGGRFPVSASLGLRILRWIKVGGIKARVGVRVINALNHFNPRDLQNNIHAPSFGQAFNTVDREFRILFQIIE